MEKEVHDIRSENEKKIDFEHTTTSKPKTETQGSSAGNVIMLHCRTLESAQEKAKLVAISRFRQYLDKPIELHWIADGSCGVAIYTRPMPKSELDAIAGLVDIEFDLVPRR